MPEVTGEEVSVVLIVGERRLDGTLGPEKVVDDDVSIGSLKKPTSLLDISK